VPQNPNGLKGLDINVPSAIPRRLEVDQVNAIERQGVSPIKD
jgi:hypothetical protein